MAINHLVRMLEDAGASAYWSRVQPILSNNDAAQLYIWADQIHNRDYRTYEILRSGAKCYWEPQWNDSSPDLIKNAAPTSLPLSQEPNNSLGAVINQNWDLVPSASTTQFYGFGNENTLANSQNNLSPLRRRYFTDDQVDESTLPLSGSSRPTQTIPGCWNLPDGAYLQGENPNFFVTKVENSFPFTLEAWARPSNQNTADMSGNSNGTQNQDNGYCPHNVLMIACPNPDDVGSAGALATGAPDASWRHWGIGFHEANTGVPVIHWGGWKTLSPNRGQEALHVAGPDPSRQYKPDHTGAANNAWAHIVGVFHSRTEVQLFYNGVEVAYYKDTSFHEPAGQTDINFNFGGEDNRVPDISSFVGIPGTQSYVQGAVPWIGGVNWDTHQTSGPSITDHSNYAFAGRVAYPAIYGKALTAKEVMDHYMTCSQEQNMVVAGEAPNYVAGGGTDGNQKGLLRVQKTRIPGQRGADELVVRDDTLAPFANNKGQNAYGAVNPIRITDKGSIALRGRYFQDPIGPLSSGNARYLDGDLPNFNETGYGIIMSVDVRREDGIGYQGSAANHAFTFMDMTGLLQFDQPNGANGIDDLVGFKVSCIDTVGLYETYQFGSFTGTSSLVTVFNGSNVGYRMGTTQCARTPNERPRSYVMAFSHDTQAAKIHFSNKHLTLNAGYPALEDDGRIGVNVQNTYSMRTFGTSPNRAYPLVPWTNVSDASYQIGPCAIVMAGDGKATQVMSRKLAGTHGKMRTRFTATGLRRHFNLSRMAAGQTVKNKRGFQI